MDAQVNGPTKGQKVLNSIAVVTAIGATAILLIHGVFGAINKYQATKRHNLAVIKDTTEYVAAAYASAKGSVTASTQLAGSGIDGHPFFEANGLVKWAMNDGNTVVFVSSRLSKTEEDLKNGRGPSNMTIVRVEAAPK